MGKPFPDVFFAIYKSDATNTNGPAQEELRKDINHGMKIFNLIITIDTNLTVVNLLNVSLDLYKNIYKLYSKSSNRLSYINVGSCFLQQRLRI